MKHLTPNEIMEIADGFINPEELDRKFEHLKICPFCNNEVNLFRQINSSAGNFPIEKVSKDFTKDVMSNIIPHKKESYVTSFLFQRGYYLILFFIAVAAVYALLNFKWETAFSTNEVKNTLNETVTNYSNSIDSFTQEISSFFNDLGFVLFNTLGNKILFVSVAVLILAFLDKLFYKKFLKLK